MKSTHEDNKDFALQFSWHCYLTSTETKLRASYMSLLTVSTGNILYTVTKHEYKDRKHLHLKKKKVTVYVAVSLFCERPQCQAECQTSPQTQKWNYQTYSESPLPFLMGDQWHNLVL